MDNILAVIPARGGSKGIPRKNLYKIGGKTLVAHAIDMAKECGFYTVVSSEDKEILAEAFNNGASLIERPQQLADLADKQSTAIDVWRHAWINAERQFDKNFEYSVYLEPTAPLRTPKIIKLALQVFHEWERKPGGIYKYKSKKSIAKYGVKERYLPPTGLDALWTVSRIDPKYRIEKQLKLTGGDMIELPVSLRRRQEINETYYRNGMAYFVTRKTLLDDFSLTGERCRAYFVYGPSVNVDVLEDLELLEFYWKKVHPNQV